MAVLGAVAAVALVLAAFVRLRRTWPDAVEPVALVLPLAVAVAVTLGPAPRVAEESAAALAGLRAEPYRLPDPGRPGVVFHAIAWPAALALGDEAAVRLVAAVASAAGLLLGYALFRSSALEPWPALCGQAALAAVPAILTGPGHAAFAHALPQAFELLLLSHLVRRLGHLEGARDNAAAFAYLLLSQASSAMAAVETVLLAGATSTAEAATGEWRRALRLAVNAALATTAVVLVRHVPRLVEWPAAASSALPGEAWSPAPLVVIALCGTLGVGLLPDRTRGPRLLAGALVGGIAAAVLWPHQPAGPATLPGLGLLAPTAACALGALLAQVRSRWTAGAGPGSRS